MGLWNLSWIICVEVEDIIIPKFTSIILLMQFLLKIFFPFYILWMWGGYFFFVDRKNKTDEIEAIKLPPKKATTRGLDHQENFDFVCLFM